MERPLRRRISCWISPEELCAIEPKVQWHWSWEPYLLEIEGTQMVYLHWLVDRQSGEHATLWKTELDLVIVECIFERSIGHALNGCLMNEIFKFVEKKRESCQEIVKMCASPRTVARSALRCLECARKQVEQFDIVHTNIHFRIESLPVVCMHPRPLSTT